MEEEHHHHHHHHHHSHGRARRESMSVAQVLALGGVERRENLIAFFAGLTLTQVIVYVAGSVVWSQIIATILSVVTFFWLFLPTGQRGCSASAKENFFSLIKFPLFWIGLLLMIYFAIQGLNPKLSVGYHGFYWKLFVLDYNEWLPSGIDAIFGMDNRIGMNSWRTICLFGSAWLFLCSLWCGVRSRRVWKTLMWYFVVFAVVLACFGIWRWSQEEYELFGYKRCMFFSTFSYKNHASQFFVLALCAATALGLRTWRMNFERGKTSGSHFLLAIAVVLFFITALAPISAGGAAVALAWVPIIIILVLFSGLLRRESMIACAVVAFALSGLVFMWWRTGNASNISVLLNKIELKTGAKEDDNDIYFATRADYRKMSSNIFHYNKQTEIFGWGAGSYRWIAPGFQMKMKEFTRPLKSNPNYKYFRFRAEYAHCDPWQMLCEWGYIGAGIFFAGVLWFWGYALWNCRRWHVSSVALLAGTATFAAHSLVDFVSFSQALLIVLAFIMAAFKADLSRNPARIEHRHSGDDNRREKNENDAGSNERNTEQGASPQ